MLRIIKKLFKSKFGFNYLVSLRDRQRIAIALQKGLISRSIRNICLTDPLSWEFSGFSQNGEDGIIEMLVSKLSQKNKYFIEIGSADGIDNNSAWLLINHNFNGIMIEGDDSLTNTAKRVIAHYNHGLQIINHMVNIKSIDYIKSITQFTNPDVFSLDIDSIDYYVAKELFEKGFEPKIFIVEYNSAFGPDQKITVEYSENFNFGSHHPSFLYYGVSINAWKSLFKKYGYKFITVDSNGVNAFFCQTDLVSELNIKNIDELYRPPMYGEIVDEVHIGHPPSDRKMIEI